jgi:hypothetical protein
MLNPLNLGQLDNALLYDVLLLLIYNIKAATGTTSGFLGEYLMNMYKELNIDVESFANFN